MPLSKILLDIATECGIDISNANERAWIIDKVNDVAKALYESQDIDGCLREQTFNVDGSTTDGGAQMSSLVALPYYVQQLRGIRYSQVLGGKIPLNDLRPKYSIGEGWGDSPYAIPFRCVREEYPLKRDITNASVITLSVQQAQEADIDVYVVGKTTVAERAQEKITLPAGQLEVDSVGNYESIESISKSAPCNADISITDIDGNELSAIPNSELSPRYMLLELRDANAVAPVTTNSFYNLTAIDVLYKTRFTPFRNLLDEFPCGSKCDQAIVLAFKSFYELQMQGNEQRAGVFAQTARGLVSDMNVDKEIGKNLTLQFGRSGVLDAQRPRLWYGTGNTPPYNDWPSWG